MAVPRFAWGIDIGNRALKAVKLIAAGEGLAIDDFEVIEHETILSAAGDNRDELVRTALANFVARHPGIEKGQVGVGVTGQQSFARFIKLPPVESKKIPEIVRFEAIQQIPFPLDEVEWSYQLFEEPDSPEVEVGIFAMRKDLINTHIKFFTDAKLNVQVVQMNPLSVYNAMYYDSRIKGTTMIIDVGAETTDLIIAEGETVWLRSISIGGNSFTDALGKTFKVNFAKAEELKRNASTSKYGRQIMQAMRPVFSDLVSEIQRSIGFYSSIHKESRIAKVIAIGSTFKLPGLARYLSQNLTLDVEKLDRLGAGALEDPKIAAAFSENLLSAAGAYGLALQVMNQGKISSSLLPEAIRRDKMWAEKSKWFMGAAALFLVGAAIPYGRWYMDSSGFDSNQSIRDSIDGMKTQAQQLDSQWAQIEGAGATEKQKMLNVLALPAGRDVWTQINTLIYSTLPQNLPDAPKELSSSNPDDLKKIKRADRNQLLISNLVSSYTSDLAPLIADLARSADSTGVAAIPGEGNGATDFGGHGAIASPSGGMGGSDTMAPPAKTQRGFIITMKVTTPSRLGVQVVENFNAALKAVVPTTDRPIQVLEAKIAQQNRIRDNPQRIQAMIADWQRRQQEKAAAEHAAPPVGGGGGMDAPPGAFIQPPSPEPGFNGGGGFRPGPLGGGGFPGNPGGFAPPGGGGNAPDTTKIDPEAFNDPVLQEDIRDDTECIIVIAVALDVAPPAPASPPAPGAPPAPGTTPPPGAAPTAGATVAPGTAVTPPPGGPAPTPASPAMLSPTAVPTPAPNQNR
jgi:type IV pilus assembly protein PilM